MVTLVEVARKRPIAGIRRKHIIFTSDNRGGGGRDIPTGLPTRDPNDGGGRLHDNSHYPPQAPSQEQRDALKEIGRGQDADGEQSVDTGGWLE